MAKATSAMPVTMQGENTAPDSRGVGTRVAAVTGRGLPGAHPWPILGAECCAEGGPLFCGEGWREALGVGVCRYS
jgi:hypothetical protein